MAIVCLLMAVGLGIIAWRAKDEGAGVRTFWLVFALFNGAAAAHMIATGYEYAWQLAPSHDEGETSYRR